MTTYTYKQNDHLSKELSAVDLISKLETFGKSDLALSIISSKIYDGTIKTANELNCADENSWGLDDWPEDQGFGSSDGYWARKSIDDAINYQRAFFNCEEKYAKIHNLKTQPDHDKVYAFMQVTIADSMIKLFKGVVNVH